MAPRLLRAALLNVLLASLVACGGGGGPTPSQPGTPAEPSTPTQPVAPVAPTPPVTPAPPITPVPPTKPVTPTPPPASGIAPAISGQPQSATVREGNSVTFQVTASGDALQYQWLRNGQAVSGATAASYTLPSTTLDDNASQWAVRVSNTAAEVRSQTATLTVTAGPRLALLAGGAGTSNVNGTGAQAGFAAVRGLAAAPDGSVFVADGRAVRKISPQGEVSTFAGDLLVSGYVDGQGSQARFGQRGTGNLECATQLLSEDCMSLMLDGEGALLVGDSSNGAVRSVSAAGQVSTPATREGWGWITFDSPFEMIANTTGQPFFAARMSLGIPGPKSWHMYALTSGTPKFLEVFTPETWANLWGPVHMAFDATDTLYVTLGKLMPDGLGNTVRKRQADGTVVIVAGSASEPGAVDGQGPQARFGPLGKMVGDRFGNLYVADTENHAVRKISSTGLVSTAVGRLNGGSTVQPGLLPASLNQPWALAIDKQRHRLFIGDWVNNGPAVLVVDLPVGP